MIVVADTTPLNYLVLIGQIELLPTLYHTVLIPQEVHRELRQPGTPPMVRADILLMDESEGRREALRRNLKVAGTVAVLERAAQRGLIDFRTALQRLDQTNFRLSAKIREEFLKRNS
jgi:predicted nucleic acid-binding protein